MLFGCQHRRPTLYLSWHAEITVWFFGALIIPNAVRGSGGADSFKVHEPCILLTGPEIITGIKDKNSCPLVVVPYAGFIEAVYKGAVTVHPQISRPFIRFSCSRPILVPYVTFSLSLRGCRRYREAKKQSNHGKRDTKLFHIFLHWVCYFKFAAYQVKHPDSGVSLRSYYRLIEE